MINEYLYELRMRASKQSSQLFRIAAEHIANHSLSPYHCHYKPYPYIDVHLQSFCKLHWGHTILQKNSNTEEIQRYQFHCSCVFGNMVHKVKESQQKHSLLIH